MGPAVDNEEMLRALMLTGMGATLYDLQVVNGRDYYEQSQRKIAETETVEAARGSLLDRYGRELVTNRTSYNVALETSKQLESQMLMRHYKGFLK